MRTFDSDDEYDVEEAKRLRAELWMLDLLACNPDYVSWGPHEDYMWKREEAGWEGPMLVDTWSDLDLHLDDLNEVVNFYFFIDRAGKECLSCGASGYAPEAKRLHDDFYGLSDRHRRWCDKITLDELEALVREGRIKAKNQPMGAKEALALLADVNEVNGPGRKAFGLRVHDAINANILLKQRCERLGFPLTCPTCDGHGHVFTEDKAHAGLVMWLLHPRKGASRGVEVARVKKSELPAISAFLKQAAERNAARFAKVGVLARSLPKDK